MHTHTGQTETQRVFNFLKSDYPQFADKLTQLQSLGAKAGVIKSVEHIGTAEPLAIRSGNEIFDCVGIRFIPVTHRADPTKLERWLDQRIQAATSGAAPETNQIIENLDLAHIAELTLALYGQTKELEPQQVRAEVNKILQSGKIGAGYASNGFDQNRKEIIFAEDSMLDVSGYRFGISRDTRSDLIILSWLLENSK